MELWNRRDLHAPPNNSVKIESKNIDISHLKHVLNQALEILCQKLILHKEAAILSRYIYRTKRRMRGHKTLMFLQKVNRGLQRYITLNLQHVYRNFYLMLTCEDNSDDYFFSKWVYIPTKQMLQYLLVRTQGFCKLMCFVAASCRSAYLYFRGILLNGHLVNECLLCIGIVSRIWFCARYNIICACQWYSQLLPYLEKLQILGPSWLPEEYEFPGDIRMWLESEAVFGDLSYNADIQKISDDISYTKLTATDMGVVIDRKLHNALLNTTANLSSKDFCKGNEESQVVTSDANLMLSNMESSSSSKRKSFDLGTPQNVSGDVGELISCDELFSEKARIKDECEVHEQFSYGVQDHKKMAELQSSYFNIVPKSEKGKMFLSALEDSVSNQSNETDLFLSLEHNGKLDLDANSIDASGTFHSEHKEMCHFKTNENTASVRTKIKNHRQDNHATNLVTRSSDDKLSNVHGENISDAESFAKKHSQSTNNWEIINGIKTIKDLKVFLLSEKKARAKGKSCVSSELNKSEWNILVDAIRKILKKKTLLKSKGDKLNMTVIEEIQNTLVSFIV